MYLEYVMDDNSNMYAIKIVKIKVLVIGLLIYIWVRREGMERRNGAILCLTEGTPVQDEASSLRAVKVVRRYNSTLSSVTLY